MEKEMLLTKFETYLRGEEKSESTISKYLYDVGELLDFMGQECLSKELLIQYRGYLSRKCRARTVNGKLSAVNTYLKCMGLEAHKVKFLKVQKRMYMDEKRELTEQDCRKQPAVRENPSYISSCLYYMEPAYESVSCRL